MTTRRRPDELGEQVLELEGPRLDTMADLWGDVSLPDLPMATRRGDGPVCHGPQAVVASARDRHHGGTPI
jgi:hypothetical protein